MNYRYEIIIHWSDEDNVFVAEVPELPGCMAHGNDYDNALMIAASSGDMRKILLIFNIAFCGWVGW